MKKMTFKGGGYSIDHFFDPNAVCVSIQYCPLWKRGGLCFHENGGRLQGECLDMTIVIYKLNFGLTIWDMRALACFLRFVPRPKKSGYTFGIFPVGSEGQ